MSNVEVLLETDSIAVIGGPASITVQTDVGPQGKRGSQIYVGSGVPSSSTIPNYAYLITGDVYINSTDKHLYQYVLHTTGNQWDDIVSLAV